MKTKIIFFTGGVYSSVGKGLTLASVGRIFKELGFKVSVLKFDPYLNINSGNLSPEQHGEVYVTSDGHETDLDLGHYERFMNYKLTKQSCITAGTIYKSLLEKQENDFSGDTIQVIPHVVNEINSSIYALLEKEKDYDFLFVEIGGTVGDIESLPFLEAAHRFRREYGEDNVFFIHISPIFKLKLFGEFKTKATQHSLKQLISHNIFPNLLILRCDSVPQVDVRPKISVAAQMDPDNMVYSTDQESIYLIAEKLYEADVHSKILSYFRLSLPKKNLDDWKKLTSKILQPKKYKLKLALIGKYTLASDAYISIIESFKIASYQLSVELTIDYISSDEVDLEELKEYGAICVPHGFGSRGTEGKIKVIEYCRVNKIPFLGICFGMQLACIEYMRNVLNYSDCNSTEIDPDTKTPLFIPVSTKEMRLGSKKIKIIRNTYAYELFKEEIISERHRHKYYLNPEYIGVFKDTDFVLSAFSDDEEQITEMIELRNHPFFVATQFHPEFETNLLDISPLFLNFLKAGVTK
ncbi:CTP synthase [Candidatus Mycoplasma haematobovis]|uniref:CTP synthase (glutamine hydrolyzing) n=1 Tax=Candidatus Mycoplasma haematobovis TaxID=432608 RepID=A0A1A9QCU2_9MOLU|nr:CTP synthase [Candidatus Mycoplasma haematobovis]OAL10402.1 CTP synthase [Candidatus Mycoplasma haematobovis]